MKKTKATALSSPGDKNSPAGHNHETTYVERLEKRNVRINLAIFFLSLFSLIAVAVFAYIAWDALRTKVAQTKDYSNLLAAVLPVVVGALTALVSMMGLNRLKNFDERQDNIRKEIRDDIVDVILPPLIDKQLGEKTKSVVAAIEAKQSAFEEAADKIEALISSVPGLMDIVQDQTNWSKVSTNIQWVHDFVQAQFARIDNTLNASETIVIYGMVKSLVDAVCLSDSNITGEPDDYHNLASELARNNQYDFAVQVLEKGISLSPENLDLLAGILLFSQKQGKEQNDIESRLTNIEKKYWNWRAFTFYIDALNLRSISDDNYKTLEDAFTKYIEYMPDEERAYMAKHEVLERYGKHKEAVQALVDGETTCAYTAQCSGALAKIYRMTGKFDAAICSATRSILSGAESQPSSNTGAAYAERAFTRDAKIHKKLLDDIAVEELYDEIGLAISDYDVATSLGYKYNIKQRLTILKNYLPESQGNTTASDDDDEDDDVSQHNEKALLILEAISICGSKEAFEELLEKLQELSPISPINRSEYDALFLEYAHNDAGKAKRLKEIVETLFGS